MVLNQGDTYKGTYGITYTANSATRPTAYIPLTNAAWTNQTLTSGADVLWFTFNVTNATTYYIWFNTFYEGNSTKTADAVFSARYLNEGTWIFEGESNGWITPQSFTASKSGTVEIRVQPYNSVDTSSGTFGIAYRSSLDTRPTP
jgi:P pilus assembly chaperone PapD